MISFSMLRRLALVSVTLALLSSAARAADAKPAAPQNPAPDAAMIAGYPLDTCVVAEEKLGEMGKPYDYLYKKDGQPDRLVRFCCKGCLPDFKKDPEKYLKRIDDAAAAKKS